MRNLNLLEFIKNPENSSKFGRYFKEIKVPAHTVLLKEGEIAGKMFFVKEGCLRMWYNNDGNDVTFQFFFEGQGVASIESLWNDKPSLMGIESIEDSVLYVINKKDFMKLFNEEPAVKDRMFQILLARFENYALHFLSQIKNSPAERYRELLRERPYIIRRVPQHYIASYLGVTPVSLSRIRNKIQREGAKKPPTP
jgi:CRP-like cAMP-binding protein